GRERAALQARPADEAEADAARPQVALDHGDLREIPVRIGHGLAGPHGRLLEEVLGHDLVLDEPDYARLPALPGDPEVGLGQRLDAHRVLDPFGHVRMRDVLDDATELERDLGLEALE